ncbi:hypothetical protein [Paenibacillus sp. F4]|uniref:hypothetical protein n=1 Tax=Paenibacillus sp. F4 TaxID=357385 RepID=UPI0021555515|nr:hypothetical protein [Paenibacillus sp. F4]
MEKMYPPVVNSPKTELTELITDTQTEITVANASVLLQGEGIAVLGNGDAAETITYTSLEDNVLKGCVRGFEGVARAWPTGTRIARNFTAADWRAVINNIQALHEESSSESRKPITLQPGVQIVKIEKQTVFNLAGLTGKTVIDYDGQKGVFGVRNPYVIRYGENLIPSFFEWVQTSGGIVTIQGAYKATASRNTADIIAPLKVVVPVLPNTTYTMSSVGDGLQYIERRDSNDSDPSGEVATGVVVVGTKTFTTSAQTHYLSIRLRYDKAGTFTHENPMLNIGSTTKPFKPREDSMLAIQTDLYADPVTGANADVVFERDGQYFKSKKWQGVVLDGSLPWVYFDTAAGYKVVRLPIIDSLSNSERVTKFDGKLIQRAFPVSGADQSYLSASSNVLGLTISVADSGWGDGYMPTVDDIKAYFFGYKAYDANTITPATAQAATTATWTGTGTKYWVQRVGAANFTQSAPQTSYVGYTPYKLVYQLATPTVEPIVSEGQLTFIEGDNQVEVGTGIVLREGVKAARYEDNMWINGAIGGSTPLKKRPKSFLAFYKDGKRDNWKVRDHSSAPNIETYGLVQASTPLSNFSDASSYSVTYMEMVYSPTVPFTGSYAANEKSLLSDLVESVQQNTARLSVVENKKAEKDVPAWISPSILFNGWVSMGVLGYRKIDNKVQLKARIKSGVIGQPFMALPEGYRPLVGQIRPVHSYGTSDVFASVLINADGKLIVSGGSNSEVNIYLEFTTD